MILELVLIISIITNIVLLICALINKWEVKNAEMVIKHLEKQNIDLGMEHNRSMVYYAVQARRVRRLVRKFNKFYGAIHSSFLDGLSIEDRLDWFKSNKIDDWEFEYSKDSSKDIVDETIDKRNQVVAMLKIEQKNEKRNENEKETPT